MPIPIILGLMAMGAMAGAATNRKNPMKGALMGAGLGATGGLLAPAALGAAGAAGAAGTAATGAATTAATTGATEAAGGLPPKRPLTGPWPSARIQCPERSRFPPAAAA